MTELSDKEIVAACARSAGKEVDELATGKESPFATFVILDDGHIYNPLANRAQAMELGESDPVLFAKVVGVWASRGGKDNLLHMICHAFAGKQIEKEKNADD